MILTPRELTDGIISPYCYYRYLERSFIVSLLEIMPVTRPAPRSCYLVGCKRSLLIAVACAFYFMHFKTLFWDELHGCELPASGPPCNWAAGYFLKREPTEHLHGCHNWTFLLWILNRHEKSVNEITYDHIVFKEVWFIVLSSSCCFTL